VLKQEWNVAAPDYEAVAARWVEYKRDNPVFTKLIGEEAFTYQYPESDLHNFNGI
jgi:hypothetical protein